MGCSSCNSKPKKLFIEEKVSEEPIKTSIENLDNVRIKINKKISPKLNL
jgi:hypothetical protein